MKGNMGRLKAYTPAQRRRIQRADSETLLRWSEQVLFAQTADEALA
ncbi:MAG: hypothetical protein ACXW2B_20475 [Methylomagnum sp.]